MTRASDYGEFLAAVGRRVLQTLPEPERDEYRSKVIEKVDGHTFEPKEKGAPIPENADYDWKLSEIVNDLDLSDPEHLAAGVIEAGNMTYKAPRANAIKKAFLANF